MATYAQLYQVIGNEVEGSLDLKRKVGVAGLIAANLIASGADSGAPFSQSAGAHDQRVKWAELVYQGSDVVFSQLFRAVIAANASATQAQILTASDATIQSSVNAIVDTLAANL